MIDFFKDTFRPASFTTLLTLLSVGVVLINIPALARWGRRWLTAVVLMYWVLSCPLSVRLLARTLTAGYTPLASAEEARGAQAVVLLSGGTFNLRGRGQQLPLVTPGTGLRALEAARVYRMLGTPLVIASGGVTDRHADSAPESTALMSALAALAVPPDRIVPESESKNTRDEAVVVTRMLRERGITRFVLVTSPLHMRRSMASFATLGLQPIASVAPLTSEGGASALWLVPHDLWLSVGDGVIYEWAARLYYWWNGWLS